MYAVRAFVLCVLLAGTTILSKPCAAQNSSTAPSTGTALKDQLLAGSNRTVDANGTATKRTLTKPADAVSVRLKGRKSVQTIQ